MAIITLNQRLTYRPLFAGVMLCSDEVQRSGTVGFFGTRTGADRWCVTAAHVVSSSRAVGVAVWQPTLWAPGTRISKGSMVYAAAPVDLVAFRLDDGIAVEPAILELGRWTGVAEPVVGMIVMKSGSATGVTRGRVVAVRADGFDVQPDTGMPPGYVGYDQGDSGAAWMTPDGRKLVGIHVARAQGTGAGIAIRMSRALSALNLRLL